MSTNSSNSDGTTLFNTVAIFGIISVIVYFLLIRTHHRANRRNQQQTVAGGTRGGIQEQNNNGNQNNNNATATVVPTIGKPTSNGRCLRVPPHVSAFSAKNTLHGGANILTDGIVSFRHTKAAIEDQTLTEEEIIENRKDRARILARILDGTNISSNNSNNNNNGTITTSTATSAGSSNTNNKTGGVICAPPPKGSTIVVSIPYKDVDCPKLRRVLYLLGTFYNLFTIIVIDEQQSFTGTERENFINRLRGPVPSPSPTTNNDNTNNYSDSAAAGTEVNTNPFVLKNVTKKSEYLSPDVLPSHRIIGAASVNGRVAFARQLQRIELMLDFDTEVKKLLSRFGHKVHVYSQEDDNSKVQQKDSHDCISQLGKALY